MPPTPAKLIAVDTAKITALLDEQDQILDKLADSSGCEAASERAAALGQLQAIRTLWPTFETLRTDMFGDLVNGATWRTTLNLEHGHDCPGRRIAFDAKICDCG